MSTSKPSPALGEKHVALAKKLKRLADSGVDGEKANAEKLLFALLKKHGISLEDIQDEIQQDYFFIVTKKQLELFNQIANVVCEGISVYQYTKEKVKRFGLSGNTLIRCTAANYVEIKVMFEHYWKLYSSELTVFYSAFLHANNLLVSSPNPKGMADLTEKELDEYFRKKQMARSIKSESHQKRIS